MAKETNIFFRELTKQSLFFNVKVKRAYEESLETYKNNLIPIPFLLIWFETNNFYNCLLTGLLKNRYF